MHRTSLEVQSLGFGAFMAKGPGSISGQGTKILQAVWHVQKKKKIACLTKSKTWDRTTKWEV